MTFVGKPLCNLSFEQVLPYWKRGHSVLNMRSREPDADASEGIDVNIMSRFASIRFPLADLYSTTWAVGERISAAYAVACGIGRNNI
jgi:hypothetical protein